MKIMLGSESSFTFKALMYANIPKYLFVSESSQRKLLGNWYWGLNIHISCTQTSRTSLQSTHTVYTVFHFCWAHSEACLPSPPSTTGKASTLTTLDNLFRNEYLPIPRLFGTIEIS